MHYNVLSALWSKGYKALYAKCCITTISIITLIIMIIIIIVVVAAVAGVV